VLATPAIVVPVGESVDLINAPIGSATSPRPREAHRHLDRHTFNAGMDDTKVKYRIRGQPFRRGHARDGY